MRIAASFKHSRGGLVMDARRVHDVFARVAAAAGHPTQLVVVRDSTINAWTDGHQVFVTDALLASMPEREVAAVLGHELGHIVERHLATTDAERQRLRETLKASVSDDWLASAVAAAVVEAGLYAATGERSRTLERRADRYGERYARAAGYTQGAMTAALGNLPQESTTHSHPSTADRHRALSRGRTLRVKIARKR